jgi:hypothetical protein
LLMVDVSSQNNSVSINVSTGGNSASIKATPDMAQYYSEKSREWAISNRIVDNIDYSSKYYAEKSKESEAKAENYERSVIEKYNSFVEVSNQAEAEFQTLRDDSISQINTVASSGISDIANKTSEAVTEINSNKETATNEINNAKNNAVTQLSKEAQQQLKNIESTGFYMRDDKLYFINSEGEEEEFKSGGAGAVMFDTKIADHILQGEEALGWALQGTYVSGALYPDFYSKCLEEKNNATATETTLADSALTMFVNSNGHQFYNIADKSIVDTFYETFGIADYYGIDEENERVFLPRNKYFAVTGGVVGNGMTLGLTDGTNNVGLYFYNSSKYADNLSIHSEDYGKNVGETASGSYPTSGKTYGITTDPTKSGIVLQPNENKYLYYCVGNTEVTSAITNVTEVTTSENDTIPLFTGMYFDFKPNNVSWLKAGEQQNSAGVYKTCYDTLVQIVNGVNNYDLKVINQADMVSGVDYDEYWILDQDNLTFRTPLTISLKAYDTVAPVVGNGMSLGLTDGSQKFGLRNFALSSTYTTVTDGYGVPVGATTNTSATNVNKAVGVTSDPTKSGIEAHLVENTTAKLYFKVANAVQNLELLDAGEVLEGLANVIPGNSELIASYSKPSVKYIDLEFGASGTIYTAPENGFFAFAGRMTATGANTFLQLIDDNGIEIFKVGSQWSTSGTPEKAFVLPVSKGQRVKQLGGANVTLSYFRFVYDQSSESEAQ